MFEGFGAEEVQGIVVFVIVTIGGPLVVWWKRSEIRARLKEDRYAWAVRLVEAAVYGLMDDARRMKAENKDGKLRDGQARLLETRAIAQAQRIFKGQRPKEGTLREALEPATAEQTVRRAVVSLSKGAKVPGRSVWQNTSS